MAAILVVAALLASPAAGAKDLGGRFGIGAARTLGGVQGLDVIYWAGRLGLGGTVNLLWANPDEGDSQINITLALGVLYPIISRERAELSIGGRVNLGVFQDQDTHIALEVPLRLQFYITDHLSLFGEVGVVIDLPSGDRNLDGAGTIGGSDGFGLVIGGTYLTGGGGFTVLF
jgi:hypothetical protein